MTMSLLLEHFDDLLVTPENAEQLNRVILQLAVQGKLIEQDPNDEPAKEFLDKAFTKKNSNGSLIEHQPVQEEEKLFQVPESWEWVKLLEICTLRTGKKDVNQGSPKGKYPFFTCANKPLWSDEYSFEGPSLILPGNGANVGMAWLIDGKFEAYQRTYVLNNFLVNEKYIHHVFMGLWENHVKGKQSGSAINYIKLGNFEKFVLPIPPLAEQQRIVARVEELFAQTRALAKELDHSQIELGGLNKSALSHLLASETPEEFNQHWDFIAEHFDLLFQTPEHVAPLRQSILELAVRGKLTKDTHDWKIETLENISSDADYGTSQKCDYDASETPVLRIPNIIGGRINLDDVKHATKPEELSKDKALSPNDFLIVRTNGSKDLVGRGSVVTQEFDNDTYFASYLIRYRLANHGLWVNTIWTTRLIREQIEKIAKTSAGQYNVNIQNLNGIRIPIPPLAEQERIVKRVEQLLSLCDALEARLQSAEEERGRLVAAVMSTVGG